MKSRITVSHEGARREGRKEVPHDWFIQAKEKGVYKNNLTLKQWADEIEWRLQYKKVTERNQLGLSNSGWINFFNSLLLGKNRIKVDRYFAFASKLTPPINNPKGMGLEKSDGHVVTLQVNLSYSNDVLLEWFGKILKHQRKDNEGDLYISGEKALTEKHAQEWNRLCLLECIDFYIWELHTGAVPLNQENYRNILNYSGGKLDKNSIVTSKRKSKQIFNERVLGHIRASVRMQRMQDQ